MRHRHALHLSDNMTRQLELTAETRRVSKSAILESALQRFLSPDSTGQAQALPLLQQQSNARSLSHLERDLAITTELLATLTRYFLMITPPLPEAEQSAATALGRLRYEQVIEEVSRRVRTDQSLMERVKTTLVQATEQTASDTLGQDADHAATTSESVRGRPAQGDRDR